MRQIFVSIILLAMLVATGLGTVLAQGTPDHPHMLVQRPVVELIDGTPYLVGFRKCVDLAGGRHVPLNAHHDHIHTGRAGQALFEHAGHAVVPGAPLTPWANCAALQAALPIPVGPPPAE
jgi:hypothetical protein